MTTSFEDTLFGATLYSKETSKSAMVNLDKNTRLLRYDNAILGILRRKRSVIPKEYQWPIVASLSVGSLQAITVLWLGLKEGALPLPVILGFLRDGVNYINKRAFSESKRAWHVFNTLEQRAQVNQLSTLWKLETARNLCGVIKVVCQTESEGNAANALKAALSHDPLVGARKMCGYAIDARRALRVQDEGTVITVLADRLRKLCEKALDQHPQAKLLKKKI